MSEWRFSSDLYVLDHWKERKKVSDTWFTWGGPVRTAWDPNLRIRWLQIQKSEEDYNLAWARACEWKLHGNLHMHLKLGDQVRAAIWHLFLNQWFLWSAHAGSFQLHIKQYFVLNFVGVRFSLIGCLICGLPPNHQVWRLRMWFVEIKCCQQLIIVYVIVLNMPILRVKKSNFAHRLFC